jgi:ABC-2 type transport system permease protein
MTSVTRYLRLLFAFGRFGLANELAFRGNFVLKVLVEVLWLFILLVFYRTLYKNTNTIEGWDEHQYLFFIGCYYTMEGLLETLFLGNCTEFADLVRTGNLDAYLLQPIDEQFLVSCRWIDWSTAPKLLIGAAIMVQALVQMGWVFDAVKLVSFLVLFVCGSAMAYSFLLMLTSTSVWFMRNQSLMELWWLATTLMRYPREIYRGTWGSPLGWFFTFIIPVLLVINVPAETMVKVFDPWGIALTCAATMALLALSRWFFGRALRSYRSASS